MDFVSINLICKYLLFVICEFFASITTPAYQFTLIPLQ